MRLKNVRPDGYTLIRLKFGAENREKVTPAAVASLVFIKITK